MTTDIAESLWQARLGGAVADIEEGDKPAIEDDAYALQAAVTERSGATPAGWKVGATSEQVQEKLGLDGPMYGPLVERFCYASPAQVPIAAGHNPAIEAEFAFRLDTDLPPSEAPYTRADIEPAVGAVCPGFEIVGSRLAGGLTALSGAMLIGDGGVNVAFVHGNLEADWQRFDLTTHAVRLDVNGAEAGRGHGGMVLGHPLEAVVWLANARSRRGEGLAAGALITTGTCTGLTPIKPGDAAVGDFGDLGTIEARFTDAGGG